MWPGLISIAHAQEISGIPTSTSSTALTGIDTAGSATSAMPAPAPTTTLSIDTGAFQSLSVPTSSGDGVLAIEISTDGVNWTPVVNIDQSNWQAGSYPLPIRSWDELQHLQVALISLPNAGVVPQVYVDAIGVSVEYASGGANTTYISPGTSSAAGALQATGTASDSSYATSRIVAAPAAAAPLSARESFGKVFDPVAGQQCSVEPFSDSVAPGGSASFLLTLTPPEPPKGTTSSPAALPAPLYDASLGSLPAGISARIVSGAAGSDTIGIDASAAAVAGSYNVVVVYKERQLDGSVLPNYCEFNLRVN